MGHPLNLWCYTINKHIDPMNDEDHIIIPWLFCSLDVHHRLQDDAGLYPIDAPLFVHGVICSPLTMFTTKKENNNLTGIYKFIRVFGKSCDRQWNAYLPRESSTNGKIIFVAGDLNWDKKMNITASEPPNWQYSLGPSCVSVFSWIPKHRISMISGIAVHKTKSLERFITNQKQHPLSKEIVQNLLCFPCS